MHIGRALSSTNSSPGQRGHGLAGRDFRSTADMTALFLVMVLLSNTWRADMAWVYGTREYNILEAMIFYTIKFICPPYQSSLAWCNTTSFKVYIMQFHAPSPKTPNFLQIPQDCWGWGVGITQKLDICNGKKVWHQSKHFIYHQKDIKPIRILLVWVKL